MIDVRLVAPALAAWAASLITLLALSAIEPIAARHVIAVRLLIGVIAASILITVMFATIIRRGMTWTVILGAAALASTAASAQVAAWTDPVIHRAMGGDVHVSGSVAGPPRESLGVAYLPVTTHTIEVRGTATAIRVPVTVTVPRFAEVPPAGTPIAVQGSLRPAGSSITTAAYLDPNASVRTIGSPSPLYRGAHAVRSSLISSLPESPPGGAALVAGLAIGDESQMSPELVENMRMSGLAHLTAVSGGNVAIVVGAVAVVAWLLHMPMFVRIAVSLLTLVFYVVVVHPQPSVLRAGVMGVVVLLSLLFGGRRPGPSVLSTAVLVLVVVAPSLAASWGFALSVAATAGIVLLAPILEHRIEISSWGQRLSRPVTVAFAITVAAQVATAPVLVAMGAMVGLAALPANLLAMPLVPLITIAGLLAAIVGNLPFGEVPANVAAWVGAWAGEWVATVARAGAGFDLLRIRGSPVVAAALVLGVAVVMSVWWFTAGQRWRQVRTFLLTISACFLLTAIAWWAFPPSQRSWPPGGWVLAQCDVGQGDGLVIAPTARSGAVVVDTGVSARVINECLMDLGVDHISALVLTHFHADHVSGLVGVIDGRRVDSVFATVLDEPADQFAGVDHELRRRGLTLKRLSGGARLLIGDSSLEVLWPRRIITSGQISEGSVANNASIVLDARVHGLRVLLTGDIEPPAQAALLGTAGDFDVVKVPHHGSRHQHPRFAEWADAEIALISVGRDNRFGHPASETIKDWVDSGAVVLRTDMSGDIAIVVTGEDGGKELGFVTRRDMLGTP